MYDMHSLLHAVACNSLLYLEHLANAPLLCTHWHVYRILFQLLTLKLQLHTLTKFLVDPQSTVESWISDVTVETYVAGLTAGRSTVAEGSYNLQGVDIL